MEGLDGVLLVHPYASSGAAFHKKAKTFLNMLGLRGARCVAPDAPHALVGPQWEGEPRFRWFRFGEVDPDVNAPLEEFLRVTTLGGVEESTAHLRSVLKESPCEGWVCFSQGAAFVSLLLQTLAPEDELFRGLKWIVLASHFELPDERYALRKECMLLSSSMVPTLHLSGTQDVYVPMAWTQRSFEAHYSQRGGTFLTHDGKHHLPSKPVYKQALSEWVGAARHRG